MVSLLVTITFVYYKDVGQFIITLHIALLFMLYVTCPNVSKFHTGYMYIQLDRASAINWVNYHPVVEPLNLVHDIIITGYFQWKKSNKKMMHLMCINLVIHLIYRFCTMMKLAHIKFSNYMNFVN